MAEPIKRHKSLQPLSRDHHEGLLLVWKIRKGVSLKLEASRVEKYVDWFFVEHLLPHFKIEEEHLFTLVLPTNLKVRQALEEHSALIALFSKTNKNTDQLLVIADKLEGHIRFEERFLFNEIQNLVDENGLRNIEKFHANGTFCNNNSDEFWLEK